jgi:signal transduction histidine kinase
MESLGAGRGIALTSKNSNRHTRLSTTSAVTTEGEAALADDLREIKRAAEHAAELTQQLLAFSRKQMISPKTISLNDLINNSKRLLERIIGEDVRFDAQLDVDLHPIKADPTQINQVLVNLAVNARDAMSEGGKLLFKTANVCFDETACRWNPEATPGHFSLLSVTDTGHGIDREILGKIFEPFFTTRKWIKAPVWAWLRFTASSNKTAVSSPCTRNPMPARPSTSISPRCSMKRRSKIGRTASAK